VQKDKGNGRDVMTEKDKHPESKRERDSADT